MNDSYVAYKIERSLDRRMFYILPEYDATTGRPLTPKLWDMWVDGNDRVYIYEGGGWIEL